MAKYLNQIIAKFETNEEHWKGILVSKQKIQDLSFSRGDWYAVINGMPIKIGVLNGGYKDISTHDKLLVTANDNTVLLAIIDQGEKFPIDGGNLIFWEEDGYMMCRFEKEEVA